MPFIKRVLNIYIVFINGGYKMRQIKGLFSMFQVGLFVCMLFILGGCGSGGGGGTVVPALQKIEVNGTVLDSNGNPVAGAEVTINSDPVTVTTDSKGYFSAMVEAGDHTIVIKKDSMVIYSGPIKLNEGTTLSLSGISTALYNMADYMPLVEGGSCAYANVDDPSDTFTNTVFECFTFEGNSVCKAGSAVDDYAVFSNDGTSIALYYVISEGEKREVEPDFTLGYFDDGYSSNFNGAGSYFMLRVWDNLDPVTRSVYGIDDSHKNIIVWATYDDEISPNSQNAIIESNLPAGITPPSGAITDIEFHAPGTGLFAVRGVSAETGSFAKDKFDLAGCIEGDANASLVGTWELSQNKGNAVPSGTSSLVINSTTYTVTRPDCVETGTYTVDGLTLTATVVTAVGTDCDQFPGTVDKTSYSVNSTTLTTTHSIGGYSIWNRK